MSWISQPLRAQGHPRTSCFLEVRGGVGGVQASVFLECFRHEPSLRTALLAEGSPELFYPTSGSSWGLGAPHFPLSQDMGGPVEHTWASEFLSPLLAAAAAHPRVRLLARLLTFSSPDLTLLDTLILCWLT